MVEANVEETVKELKVDAKYAFIVNEWNYEVLQAYLEAIKYPGEKIKNLKQPDDDI